jgi:hypothetical protein
MHVPVHLRLFLFTFPVLATHKAPHQGFELQERNRGRSLRTRDCAGRSRVSAGMFALTSSLELSLFSFRRWHTLCMWTNGRTRHCVLGQMGYGGIVYVGMGMKTEFFDAQPYEYAVLLIV